MSPFDTSHQLFDPDNSYLPTPFQGETLYSWCSRFHRLNSNTRARLTSFQLFNDSIAGFRYDFPTNLDALSENTHRLLGTTEELIYGRTVFSIFAPFLSAPVTESVIHHMQKSGYSQITYHLGLRSSRVGTTAPLKACPSCMHADTISSGVPWWHVEHQWPTVRICPKHGDYLLMATEEFHARRLKDWFLPSDLQSINWNDCIKSNEPTTTKLLNLCNWSFRLAKRHKKPFDNELLRLTYHLRAKSMGWTSLDGSLRFNQIRQALRDAYKYLEDLPGFSFIKDSTNDHDGFIGSILHKFVGNKHPLKHVIMMEFLFGDPDIFIAEYERVLSNSTHLKKSELWAELTEPRNHLKLLVTESGYSVNAAAKQLGIPVSQAVRSIRQEGIEYKRAWRPKIINSHNETTLCRLLKSGEAFETIAEKLEIKKSHIKDYLKNQVKLRGTWKKTHQKRLLKKYRSHFLQLMNDLPNLTISQMRKMPGNGIQWLLLHDKDWLKINLPCLWLNNPNLKCWR